MKLIAFSAGRKNGNTEVFLKEALMAAEAKGVEVEFYRLKDFEMSPCTACDTFCNKDINKCPHKDDAQFLVDRFLDSDGVIVGAPVYSLTPSSLLFTFRDRVFGPKMDVSAVWEMGWPEEPFVKGRFKARPGGLISVGGALTENWTSLNLPSLFSTTFSAQTEVVDHLNIYGVADPGAATIEEEYLAKARKLGENVADAMLTGDHRWRGEKEGFCPLCHLNMVELIPGTDKVCCPVCGIYGHIRVENGASTVDWPDTWEYRRDNRLSTKGKQTHMIEIMECVKAYEPRKEEALKKLQKYRDYNACEVKSPIREAKKAALLAEHNKK